MTVVDIARADSPVPRIVDRAKAAIEAVLRQTLLDPLGGEFHEKFRVMFHAPGDRAAATALRACVRRICENAAQQVNVTFAQQVDIIARGAVSAGGAPDASDAGDSNFMSDLEAKLAALEEKLGLAEKLLGLP